MSGTLLKPPFDPVGPPKTKVWPTQTFQDPHGPSQNSLRLLRTHPDPPRTSRTLTELPFHNTLPHCPGPSRTLLDAALRAPQQDSGVRDDLCPGCRAFCPTEPHLNEKEANRGSEAERSSTKTRGSREPGGVWGGRGPGATMGQSASNGFDILYMPEDSKHCVIIYK